MESVPFFLPLMRSLQPAWIAVGDVLLVFATGFFLACWLVAIVFMIREVVSKARGPS